MEILYSSAIFAFLKRAKALTEQILTHEVGLKVGRTRFFIRNISYPLHFIAFEHPSRLGYFQADLFEIGINKTYLFETDEMLLNLLRHELAHYLTFIEFGPGVPHHGKEFHSICTKYGWSAEVSRATIKVHKGAQNEKILEKVRKLLSLGTSHHKGEAEAATLKAQELLLKYNLTLTDTSDEMLLVRVLPQKRATAKIQAISTILRTFFVHPILNHGKGSVYLELLGEKMNVEVAEYVAHFLNREFELMWKQAKNESPNLKGMAAKNSFFRGLAKGYLNQTKSPSKALIKIEKQLVEASRLVYPHLSMSKSRYKECPLASGIGAQKGQSLTIKQGIKKKTTIKFLL